MLTCFLPRLQDKKARKLTKKRVRKQCRYFHEVLTYHYHSLLQLGTLLRSKRKLEELGTVIQESRRAGH